MGAAPAVGFAQEPQDVQPPQPTLAVFLDCDACDDDHFRREVVFVSYVRDRRDAQVHVLVRSQPTGSGVEHEFEFIGLGEYSGRRDTVVYVARAVYVADEIRAGLIRTFTMGLMPYIAGSAIAERITILYEAEASDRGLRSQEDPWDLWVFTIGGGGSVSGESRTRTVSLNGRFSADRTAEDWRLQIVARGRFTRNRFELDDRETLVSTTDDYAVMGVVVRSIGLQHWGAGTQVAMAKSTSLNQSRVARARAAVEYSVFPYAESTRRRLTVLYGIGPATFDYEEITLFGLTQETRIEHSLEAFFSAVQPWGQLGGGLTATAFADDVSQHRIRLLGNLSFRIVRGLDLSFFGSIARVKDQIYLPLSAIPEEDILLRRRQLGTDFQASATVGISYRFGSIFNNIVNSRMSSLF